MASLASAVRGSEGLPAVYEYKYHPEPVHEYVPDLSMTDSTSVLRPAVRRGKLAFGFYGCRVPLSAIHARCWLGQVLDTEVGKGRLLHAKLVHVHPQVGRRAPAPLASGAVSSEQGVWPECLWHVQAPRADLELPPVHVRLQMRPQDGFMVRVSSTNSDVMDHVYRVLCQYCDEEQAGLSAPIPDVLPSSLAGTCTRTLSSEWMDSGTLAAHAEDRRCNAEAHLHEAVLRVGNATFISVDGEPASVDGLLHQGEELRRVLYDVSAKGIFPSADHRHVLKAFCERLLYASHLEPLSTAGQERQRRIVSLSHDLAAAGVPAAEP